MHNAYTFGESSIRLKEQRMKRPHLHIVVNPASAGGNTGRLQGKILRDIERSFGPANSIFITKRSLEASQSTADAIARGCELVIAIGGDGTIHEVVNGFFANGKLINPDCRLGIINSGTGNGFSQSLDIPKTLKDQIRLARFGSCRKVDIGKVTFCNHEGKFNTRYFVNECQLGIGGAVVQRVQKKYKMLGGKFGFGLGTIETVFRHPNQFLSVTIDGIYTVTGKFTGIVVANGAYTGGGMNLAPSARLDDGMFNLLMIREMSIVDRLYSFPKIYSGGHIHLDNFTYQTVRVVSIDSPEKVLVEADGELLGTTPCKVEIVPSTLHVQSITKKDQKNENNF